MALKPLTTPDVEAATIELTIDGSTVTAKDGVSLYDVISGPAGQKRDWDRPFSVSSLLKLST